MAVEWRNANEICSFLLRDSQEVLAGEKGLKA
jgi:hypothetical protein